MTVPLGTVIHGTLRPEDLIPAFYNLLKTIDPKRAGELLREWEFDVFSPVNQNDLLEDLFQALENLAPDDCYFGPIEGDHSDFGFWQYDELMLQDLGDDDETD